MKKPFCFDLIGSKSVFTLDCLINNPCFGDSLTFHSHNPALYQVCMKCPFRGDVFHWGGETPQMGWSFSCRLETRPRFPIFKVYRFSRSWYTLKWKKLSEIILKPLFRAFPRDLALYQEPILFETPFWRPTTKTNEFERMMCGGNDTMKCSVLVSNIFLDCNNGEAASM